MVDGSRNRNNGTFSNVTWTQLPSGVWVNSFNGTTSYIEIADSPSMRMTQGGTIIAWVKANSIGENNAGRIIDKSSGDLGINGYDIYIRGTNQIGLLVNGATLTTTSVNALPFAIWKMVIITMGTSRKIYVNAVDVTASGGSETALPPDIAGAVRIGNRAGAIDFTFNGQMSPLRMLGKIFTQADVTRIFTAERPLYGV
jgi:molybdopterin-binding protein